MAGMGLAFPSSCSAIMGLFWALVCSLTPRARSLSGRKWHQLTYFGADTDHLHLCSIFGPWCLCRNLSEMVPLWPFLVVGLEIGYGGGGGGGGEVPRTWTRSHSWLAVHIQGAEIRQDKHKQHCLPCRNSVSALEIQSVITPNGT